MVNANGLDDVLGSPLSGSTARGPGVGRDEFATVVKAALARDFLGSGGRSPEKGFSRLAKNAARSPQSVIKRIRNGGTHDKKGLKIQLNYITRDEATVAAWTNFNGVEREVDENTVDEAIPLFTSGWAGNPKRGHTDHIILSFPKDTDPEVAEAVSREWGRAVFGSGDFGDQWRYVASTHANTDHVHTHFVVDKHGIENGRFMSISNKSELTYDVMKSLHVEISERYGLNLNASSRFSRGIVDHPVRETDYRKAHHHGAEDNVDAPPLSDAELEKRTAIVHSFSRQYRALAAIANLTSEAGSPGFMTRLGNLFSETSTQLENGFKLMADADVNTQHPDPSAALYSAQQQFFETAEQTWDNIRGMDPSAEKIMLEAEYMKSMRAVREAAIDAPFFEQAASIVPANDDPYYNETIHDLQLAKDRALENGEAVDSIDQSLGEIRDQLRASFAERESELDHMGTNADEMAERFMLGERTAAQLDAWQEDHVAAETYEFETSINESANQLRSEYRDMGYDDDRIDAEVDRFIGQQRDQLDNQFKPDSEQSYRALLNDFEQRTSTIVDDYEVPRDIEEMVAKDQLLQADRYSSLSDVPAIERIVDRLHETLSDEDLERVKNGDASALREEVQDPAIRAAVAAEMRDEADLTPADKTTIEDIQKLIQGRDRTHKRAENVVDNDDYSL